MDRLLRTMRNTRSARQAGEMAPTPTSVDGLETVETRNYEISRAPPARHRCAGRREDGGQLRWTVAPCEHASAENRFVQRLLCLARTSRPHGSWLVRPAEPPDADPHVRSCGRGEWATTPPMPIEFYDFCLLAMPASVASTAMATAASVEATATVKPATASMKSTAMEAVSAVKTTVTAETLVRKSAPAAITITTATVIAPAVVAMPIAIVAPSVVAPAIEATTVVSMEPWASPNEDSVYEPIWAVIAVRRASIWVIIIVAVAADRCRTNIPVRWPNSNADKDSLCVGEGCRT